MVLVAPDEAARRARAAIAYAGLEYDEVSTRTGIKEGTLRNIVSKTRPSGGSPERLHRIALACGIPPAFMDTGFAPLTAPIDDVTARLLELERSTGARLEQLERSVKQRAPLPLTASELRAELEQLLADHDQAVDPASRETKRSPADADRRDPGTGGAQS